MRVASASVVALTVLFGVQTLRTLLPLLAWIFRDRFGWGSAQISLLVLAVFATAFLAAPLRGLLGARRLPWLAIGGLGLLRLAYQLWTGDPLIDFFLTAAASACFVLALPALLAARGSTAGLPFAFGCLVGLGVDVAIHAAYGTWDVSWRSDAPSALLVLALVVLLWWLLARSFNQPGEAGDAPFPLAWAWVAIGPFFFLELLILGNVARLAALTGWGLESAASWLLAGKLMAIGAVVFAARRTVSRAVVATLAAMLLVALWFPALGGWPAALLLLAAQVASAVLLTRIVLAIGAAPAVPGLGRLTAAHGVGMVAFAALVFLFYAGIDLRLPFSNDVLPRLAALVLGLAALAAFRSESVQLAPAVDRGWWALVALLALPVARLATVPEVRPGEAGALPLRLMTYNLHCGIDPRGHLGMEAIAATIEAERPDVVALQEVSRGWVIAGSVDALGWLSRRLEMPYVFAPTSGPLWGNAILSRLPLSGHEAHDLPTEDLLIRRGFLAARIDLGAGEDIEVLATHYHHPGDGGAVRELQSRAILEYWRGRGRTALLGDLNARPDEPEMMALRRAGLRDVLELGGVSPGTTYPSSQPVKRIDYIWISPDLTATDAVVPRAGGSDHLPVAATIAPAPASRDRALYVLD